jgi:hypothetical protein
VVAFCVSCTLMRRVAWVALGLFFKKINSGGPSGLTSALLDSYHHLQISNLLFLSLHLSPHVYNAPQGQETGSPVDSNRRHPPQAGKDLALPRFFL